MNLLNISFVILIIVGLLFAAYGLHKKSQLSIFFGGMAFLAPVFHFIGWTPVLPFVAPIALVISYFGMKKVNPLRQTL
ncbi:hypothetical protein MH117_18800 [Paenibacillus sp. ACRRX]|uniref:hypothetical protein n=1 Tax=unclassified Paenibacillus TaxID=185978 RepID=UPI001EF6E118|nr:MULTISPECIES: hypothetical protein [unclassified Paenibacillus]MCG7409462.1 hypothetical protein [Paenibacillus sp. ACRRX]MDK8180125.1 hypothetical protein [Paenibacillus sp. UMB4589-SE434]